MEKTRLREACVPRRKATIMLGKMEGSYIFEVGRKIAAALDPSDFRCFRRHLIDLREEIPLLASQLL
jgi:hypothetical protein